MYNKPAVLISYDTAGAATAELVGTPAQVLEAFRERMKAGGLGAAALIALTGRGIEKRAKFSPAVEPVKQPETVKAKPWRKP